MFIAKLLHWDMRGFFFSGDVFFSLLESSCVVWCCVSVKFVFGEFKVSNQSETETGHYRTRPAPRLPACCSLRVTAACILLANIRLSQWERNIFAVDFIHAFPRRSRKPVVSAAGQATVRASITAGPTWTMPRLLSLISISSWLYNLHRCGAKWMLLGAISSSR